MTAAVAHDADLAALVRAAIDAESGEDLVPLLEETAPLYAGKSARRAARIRGYLLAALAQASTPDEALPFVLDELENGRDPHAVGGAAVAVRGIRDPGSDLTGYLLAALRNIRHRDDALVLSTCDVVGHASRYTTAVTEIVTSLGWLGAHGRPALPILESLAVDLPAHDKPVVDEAIAAITAAPEPARTCCASRRAKVAVPMAARLEPIADVGAVDQRGRAVTLGDYFARRTTVVGFFYTRCDNPNKCSLTVTRLARLVDRLTVEAPAVQVAALTYDPAHDRPELLRTYGTSRGFTFSDAHRFLRVDPADLDRVRDTFELGVSYVGSVVQRHRIELYVVTPDGRIATRFARLQWDEDAVVAALRDTTA